jgi:structural hemagglutinin/hemolysin toxin protein RtxA
MIQIVVFIPAFHKEAVKQAMFEAGAGMLGNYDRCCFEHPGTGQFRPLKGSHAFVGEVGKLELVEEVKVEMMCDEKYLSAVITAMKLTHPYETPAYYAINTVNI